MANDIRPRGDCRLESSFNCNDGYVGGPRHAQPHGQQDDAQMTIEHAIHIGAPPDVVWRVTEDVERWPEWTPTLTSVTRLDEAPFGPGSIARIKQPGQPEAEWVVTVFEPGQRFEWETRRPGLRMVATHEISPAGAGTKNVLRVEAKGPVAVLLWPVLGLVMRRALAAENVGLKTYCEQTVKETSLHADSGSS
jgi:uncharacterized protein YndB with AHSA1/START domain